MPWRLAWQCNRTGVPSAWWGQVQTWHWLLPRIQPAALSVPPPQRSQTQSTCQSALTVWLSIFTREHETCLSHHNQTMCCWAFTQRSQTQSTYQSASTQVLVSAAITRQCAGELTTQRQQSRSTYHSASTVWLSIITREKNSCLSRHNQTMCHWCAAVPPPQRSQSRSTQFLSEPP